MTPTPDQTPERPLDDCPFCGSKVKFYEVDPGAPFCGYYLGITHVHEDESFDDENPCPGNRLDNAIKVCTDQQWAFAKNYATRKQAEDELADGWNRRITDALRATNSTLAERVRSLEEALTALMHCANAAAEWCNTSMMDDEIMHAEAILTDSASPVLPIKQAFCALHQAWLVAHHRSCMNETMDALAVVLGLDPMNPSKGLPTPGAAVGKEGE